MQRVRKQMAEVEIVRMRDEHISRIAELEKICFAEPWSENSLREELNNPDAYFLTALSDGEVLGYAGMHLSFGDGYVDNIAVFPEFRGKHVGEMLTSALAEKAAQEGRFITLEVRESNVPAIRLYEKLGFVPAGKRKNFYTAPREDAVIYTRTFNKQI